MSSYSLHQRSGGTNSAERLQQRRLLRLQNALLIAINLTEYDSDTESESDDGNAEEEEKGEMRQGLALAVAVTNRRLAAMRLPRLLQPQPVPHRRLDLSSFSNADCDRMMGFSAAQVQSLCEAFDIPEFFTLNADRHAHRVGGQHAFTYLLYHYRSPSQRSSLDTAFWGYDYSVLSKMFKVCLMHIDERFGHLLQQLPNIVNKFDTFNAAIVRKFQARHPDRAVPADATHCALFADGTRIRVCRPCGEDWMQRAVYSGHKHFHNAAALAVSAPDGMVYHWYDEEVGRHRDQYLLRESNVNQIMANIQQGREVKFWVYTDKGFAFAEFIRCAAHGPGPVTAEQAEDNGLMSPLRVPAEWIFGKIYERCPLLRETDKLKLRQMDVAQMIRVAVLLTNAHTCLNGSNTAEYFDCPPPTLDEYFAA
jgi:hypothetical protein